MFIFFILPLVEKPHYPCEECLVTQKVKKKTVVVYTAHKGDTLQGVLEEISKDGWSCSTIGDWYRYYTEFPFTKGEMISTPGTIHYDENYKEWTPCIYPLKEHFIQRIIKRKKSIIAEVLLKPRAPFAKFQTKRNILISRIVKEPKGPSS
ncbi:MAG: hypothetical protein HY228_02460 [Candidatus Yonathbacteria bacterium]|nr:hypothetical protein [Candidatus Yonathbacteria bacterium]